MPRRIDHVAIIVRNIEQALVFYRDTLGITPSEIKEVPTEQVRIAFLPMGGPGGSARHPVGHRRQAPVMITHRRLLSTSLTAGESQDLRVASCVLGEAPLE